MKKILIVEDEKGMREALRDVFEGAGYEVLTAEDGEKALELVRKNPDLSGILLDIILPKKDGFEVLTQLQSKPESKKIPVILCTNLSETEDIQKALDLGATTYLVKSNYGVDDVLKKVGDVISKAG